MKSTAIPEADSWGGDSEYNLCSDPQADHREAVNAVTIDEEADLGV